ncbi:TIGR03643 family protein [Rhodonellum ikkaensis]|nr:TIGR03643 family protein [Rhodonellum ikkaensis]
MTVHGFEIMGNISELTDQDIDRVIEMAWEDRTAFDAIERQFNLVEKEVITIMRREMKPSSFRMWRERVQGRKTKHAAKATEEVNHFKSKMQKGIALNKMSKRN